MHRPRYDADGAAAASDMNYIRHVRALRLILIMIIIDIIIITRSITVHYCTSLRPVTGINRGSLVLED